MSRRCSNWRASGRLSRSIWRTIGSPRTSNRPLAESASWWTAHPARRWRRRCCRRSRSARRLRARRTITARRRRLAPRGGELPLAVDDGNRHRPVVLLGLIASAPASAALADGKYPQEDRTLPARWAHSQRPVGPLARSCRLHLISRGKLLSKGGACSHEPPTRRGWHTPEKRRVRAGSDRADSGVPAVVVSGTTSPPCPELFRYRANRIEKYLLSSVDAGGAAAMRC